MTNQLLHDWTLTSITVDWKIASVSFNLIDRNLSAMFLVFEGVSELYVPKANEWGQSSSINCVTIERWDHSLEASIEMQSGDVIRIKAAKMIGPEGNDTNS
jgi:hypothetical protein